MKRKWFQIHLSTAIALTVVTAFFLWLNTQVSRREQKESIVYSSVSGGPLGDRITYYGWPCDSACVLSAIEKDGTEYFYEPPWRGWLLRGIVVNVLFAMTFILFIWIACESLIRRVARH